MANYVKKEEYTEALWGENSFTKTERILQQYHTERLENIGFNLKQILETLQKIEVKMK
jgi:hypothetical protein